MSWKFPKAPGSYHVACTDVINKTGPDSVLFRLYYPTTPFEPNENICPKWIPSPEYAEGFGRLMKSRIVGGLVKRVFGDIRIPVLQDGPFVMPAGQSKLPIVTLSHGLALFGSMYCYMAYTIASHGFVVGALDHRDGSCCTTFYLDEEKDKSGSLIKKWLSYQRVVEDVPEEKVTRNKQVIIRVNECSKFLDCLEMLNAGNFKNVLSENVDLSAFKGNLDLNRCAVTGHSFGGSTAIESLIREPRFRVGIALDGWMFPVNDSIYTMRAEKPLLFINSDCYQTEVEVERMRKMDADVTGVDAERKMTTLLGARHMTQSDLTFLVKTSWLAKLFHLRGVTDPNEANDVNMKLILSFIGKHLDLPFGIELEKVVEENPTLVIAGSNHDLDEKKIAELKEELKVPKELERGEMDE